MFIANKFLTIYLKTGVVNGAVWNVFSDSKYTINLCLFGRAFSVIDFSHFITISQVVIIICNYLLIYIINYLIFK
jgi:hypothetical protein